MLHIKQSEISNQKLVGGLVPNYYLLVSTRLEGASSG